jgi:hypothetical protein
MDGEAAAAIVVETQIKAGFGANVLERGFVGRFDPVDVERAPVEIDNLHSRVEHAIAGRAVHIGLGVEDQPPRRPNRPVDQGEMRLANDLAFARA